MKKMGRLWMQVEEIRGVLEAAKRGIHSQLETRAARILKKKKQWKQEKSIINLCCLTEQVRKFFRESEKDIENEQDFKQL